MKTVIIGDLDVTFYDDDSVQLYKDGCFEGLHLSKEEVKKLIELFQSLSEKVRKNENTS